SLSKNQSVATAALPPGTIQRTLAIIMGGGAGTRLFPLTKDRAKPAVPLGGKYRIVDIPISNCLNSGLRSIYVLTQFNSMSLRRKADRRDCAGRDEDEPGATRRHRFK